MFKYWTRKMPKAPAMLALCLTSVFVYVAIHRNFKLVSSNKAVTLSSRSQITSETTEAKVFEEKALVNDEMCQGLLYGTAAGNKTAHLPDDTKDQQVLDVMQKGCKEFKKRYLFEINENDTYITEDEKNYPIAFSILAHRYSHQLIRLLSAIYAPQNVYCIHLDTKTPKPMQKLVDQLNSCFPNVFRSSKSEDVVYAGFSRLQADINCMNDLLDHKNSWVHLINLCAQDYPLSTNFEIVQQLKVLKGRNAIGGHLPGEQDLERTTYVYRIHNITNKNGKVEKSIMKTSKLKSPAPHGITIYKNLAYNVYARTFLKWALRDSKKAEDFLDWSRDTYSPDEHYWRSLEDLKEDVPGAGFRKDQWQVSRYIQWGGSPKPCKGYWRHYICVFGSRDLERLTKSPLMFVNKLDAHFDSRPIACLRKWLDERKRRTFAVNSPKLPLLP